MSNTLFPIFVKVEQLPVLVIGGGVVALEKVQAILKNAPLAQVKIIAQEVSVALKDFLVNYPQVLILEKPFEVEDLQYANLVIIAINDAHISAEIAHIAHLQGKLLNVADKPNLCDFYLGAIVQKGNLKIAISTNGKSPTLAKRIKELLHEAIPDHIDQTLEQFSQIRSQLKGDFDYKVKRLNELTKSFLN